MAQLGLFILGTGRHESRRIDLQLRGRSGRQGDKGESVFYYLNGTIYSSGNYLDDNKEGSWEFYNQDGILDTLINYTNE